MTYGSSTDLGYISTALADDISADLKAYALEIADTWVNSQIEGGISGTTPDMVEKAATFYAYAFILRTLYDTSLQDSPGAMKFESMAKELLNAYIAQNIIENSEAHPYSNSLTPSHAYTERNLRTVDEEDESERDNVSDEWVV